ncbi:LytR/AlgR family response regulator transcription factor [Luteibacter aegosomatissinici]|uniref:LytR/AlgR family response regulator transcription factor n=1 Tax=Luteibacter aegosomatissinici TaxID=2911539 RepID=UPI001FF8AD00|nr:LytTR family DNA-binding domain-containing protein [Luteibacter aegosomatissinici]UPG94158.1 LytTR family DNA-binding domain-containing protein [Luteibacter aegosomatissinici]
MIRVAVVDDEPLARSGVLARLRAEHDVHVVDECADGYGLAALRRDRVDVAIIDVQMPGLNGLDGLAAIPRAERPLAVLLTAHDTFAIRAFELEAVDYLLKPIDDERFSEALDRVRRKLGSDTRPALAEHFAIRVGTRLSFVEVGAVTWIEADGDYAALHANGQRHLLRESLQELARKLDPVRFQRVHRSAIVRVDQVAEMLPRPNRDAVLRLRDGTTLRASRTYIDALMAALHRVA